jgi:Zn-dependent M28 family amino/carboxypeptidase
VTPFAYDSSWNIEAQGHNLEAVLPGRSPDSVVIIVHYDSMGPHGYDNEAVDDDMTGMAMQMETARVLLQYRDQLQYTVRFVAADYEEWGGLEGARDYAHYVTDLARSQHFRVVAAIDDEQSGWKEGANTFDVFDCGGRTNSTALGNLLIATARQYSPLATHHDCMGENSDHYAMWEVGVPAVVFSEHHPFNNDHFDHAGGDTYAKIDQDYYFKIAQVGVTFAAKVVGVDADGFENSDNVALLSDE